MSVCDCVRMYVSSVWVCACACTCVYVRMEQFNNVEGIN